MPRPKLDVTKCNINLYACDKAKLEQRFGYGWTEQVREIVHKYCDQMKSVRTMADIVREEGCGD